MRYADIAVGIRSRPKCALLATHASPQHHAVESDSKPHEWDSPALSCANAKPPLTLTGELVEFWVPSPSCRGREGGGVGSSGPCSGTGLLLLLC